MIVRFPSRRVSLDLSLINIPTLLVIVPKRWDLSFVFLSLEANIIYTSTMWKKCEFPERFFLLRLFSRKPRLLLCQRLFTNSFFRVIHENFINSSSLVIFNHLPKSEIFVCAKNNNQGWNSSRFYSYVSVVLTETLSLLFTRHDLAFPNMFCAPLRTPRVGKCTLGFEVFQKLDTDVRRSDDAFSSPGIKLSKGALHDVVWLSKRVQLKSVGCYE